MGVEEIGFILVYEQFVVIVVNVCLCPGEGSPAHREDHDAQREQVLLRTLERYLLVDLGHHVRCSSDEAALQARGVHAFRVLGEAEIANLKFAVRVEQQVVQLHVEVDDAPRVDVAEGEQAFFGAVSCKLFAEIIGEHVVEHLALRQILLHDVGYSEGDLVGVRGPGFRVRLVNPNQVRVGADLLKSSHLVVEEDAVVGHPAIFVEHFDRQRVAPASFVDARRGPLPDLLGEDVLGVQLDR